MLKIISHYHSNARLQYLCVPIAKVPKKEIRRLESENQILILGSDDLLVYSIFYRRFSTNVLKVMTGINLDHIIFGDYKDFIGFVETHLLGTDLTNIWSILDE